MDMAQYSSYFINIYSIHFSLSTYIVSCSIHCQLVSSWSDKGKFSSILFGKSRVQVPAKYIESILKSIFISSPAIYLD